ncbi:MAG TPA: demethoxyubiquinone hydroxylase family protein [Rhizomicrobium sp.]|nr:demethoxyubiquinone hydroxylase family protein [Rhizomicrobium sp.]
MVEKDQLIRRILRVNHAGEHGAIAIYSAQLAKVPRQHPALTGWLQETLSHEQRHRDAFLAAMPSRGAKPCRLMAVWTIGGAMLGGMTAILGQTGIMVCTAAVERTVHKHLNDQIAYLSGHDAELAAIIQNIRVEEDEHLAYAEAHHDSKSLFARFLSAAVALLTELLIWISTRGDSLRLQAVLRDSAA